MHVYFVRHGETNLSKRFIHQSPNTPLSDRGVEEARNTAEYLRGINPDLLISSEYTRALETARIIGLHVGLEPKVTGLFYEIVRPSSLFGKSHFALSTLWYVFLSVWKRRNAAWRYQDAENFEDISNRARRALAYLESLRDTHKSIIVVSHTIFINIMISYLCESRMLSFRDLILTFLHVERMHTGEVTHVEYTRGGEGTCAWKVVKGEGKP